MSNLYINREGRNPGTGGSIDASAIAELIKHGIIEYPEPPKNLEEWFGLVNVILQQMYRALEQGETARFRQLCIFLSIKGGAMANGIPFVPLDFQNCYFITQFELDQRKEAA